VSAFDLVIRGGTVADGNGGPPRTADRGQAADALPGRLIRGPQAALSPS
jgi:hypothetical protein